MKLPSVFIVFTLHACTGQPTTCETPPCATNAETEPPKKETIVPDRLHRLRPESECELDDHDREFGYQCVEKTKCEFVRSTIGIWLPKCRTVVESERPRYTVRDIPDMLHNDPQFAEVNRVVLLFYAKFFAFLLWFILGY